jgi:hypothetical protein
MQQNKPLGRNVKKFLIAIATVLALADGAVFSAGAQQSPESSSTVVQTGAAGPVSTPAAGLVSSGVSVSQSGSSANTSVVYQYSDYSGAGVIQSGTAGGVNSSAVYQSAGSENWAGISQAASGGAANGSTIGQSGNRNIASVTQR